MSFRAKIYAVNAAKILRSKAHWGKGSSILGALKAGKDKWMQLMETGWDIDKFWNGPHRDGAAQMKDQEWLKKEQHWIKREQEWLLRAAKMQEEINKITEGSKLSREIDYEALGSWLLLRLGLIDAGAKFSGGLYTLSQKSAEEGVTELLKASSGVDSRESADILKGLQNSIADISKRQKVMQATLDRLVSPGSRPAPTLLSSTPADTVDTSTTPAAPADTTPPVADTPSSTTTPSSAAPDVDNTPEPTDIF